MILGIFWILLSDSLIYHIALNKQQLTFFQNVKDIFFI